MHYKLGSATVAAGFPPLKYSWKKKKKTIKCPGQSASCLPTGCHYHVLLCIPTFHTFSCSVLKMSISGELYLSFRLLSEGNGTNWLNMTQLAPSMSCTLSHQRALAKLIHFLKNTRILSFTYLIYSLTTRIIGAPQITSQPVSFIFLCSPQPSGTWWTPGLSIPWCCLPTSFSVCLIFFPLSLCLARWFWPDLMNRRHVHTPEVCTSLWSPGLHVSICLLDPGTDYLVGNMVFVWDA